MTSDLDSERIRLLREQLVSALQRAAAPTNEIGDSHISRHLAILADMQFARLPKGRADERFEHEDERRQ